MTFGVRRVARASLEVTDEGAKHVSACASKPREDEMIPSDDEERRCLKMGPSNPG